LRSHRSVHQGYVHAHLGPKRDYSTPAPATFADHSFAPNIHTYIRPKITYRLTTPGPSDDHIFALIVHCLPQVLASAAVEIMNNTLFLLLIAQVLGFPIFMVFIAADMRLNRKPVMSKSNFFYCCLANCTLLLLGFYTPTYLAACLLNWLGNFLAVVTGASWRDYPEVFYGNGYGYEDDAGAYCWYLLHWIWKDNAKIIACCILSVAVPAITFLTPRVWSWLFPSLRQRIERMREHTARIRADTLAIKNRLKAEHGWTDEDYERAVELGAGDDEEARARRRSFVQERRARMEQERRRETIAMVEENNARAEENLARIDENADRLKEQRTAELREQRGRLRRSLARAADWSRRLRESAPGERERRFAQVEENAARQQAETADLQDRLATEERYVEGLREGIAEMDRLSAVLQEGMDRLATMRAQCATDTTANAQGVEPASHSEAEP
jgi:hypothetical protein